MLKNAFYITLFTLISWGSYQLSYPSKTPADLFYDGMFFENVIKHVDQLTQGPRAVGDYFHADAQRYIIRELHAMGLKVNKQITTSYNPQNKSAAPIQNIFTTLAGTNPNRKKLMLLAHYDAAKFSGTGAGDDASGVAVILEAINALIKSPQHPTNDVLILFTDAEEIGLLGAHAFINEKLGDDDIGLIINLEARGSSGPVMMWPETVGGNRAMIEAFSAANVPMPVTTSLHYEIYKMLPNNTDLTPFNQQAKINGFNLAFIDDHHNYHTQLDTLENLSIDSLAHQAIQVHSMLKHFSNIDLNQLKSHDSLVYFSLPMLGLISYPTALNWVLLLVFGAVFIGLLVAAVKQKKTSFQKIFRALRPLATAVLLSYGWCWLVLQLINMTYPEVRDVMQGFPYQGHQIMLTLLVSTGIITVSVYALTPNKNKLNQILAAIIVWLMALLPLIYHLPGAGLMMWPVLLAIVLFGIELYLPKLAEQLAPIIATSTFILLGTLLINLPIAMGVAALPATAILVVSILALFPQIISPMKKIMHVCLLLLVPSFYLIFSFIQQPSISPTQPHPTSLSYLYDHDNQLGYFYNYDVTNSGWNSDLFAQPVGQEQAKEFRKKYHQPTRNLAPSEPVITLNRIQTKVLKPLKQRENLTLEVSLVAHANTEILEIYTNEPLTIHKLSIEGRSAVLKEPMRLNSGNRLLQYYFDGKKNIKLTIEVNPEDTLNWQLLSHSTDLLQQPKFNISFRPEHQIQKPFIKSDNTTVVQKLTFGLDQ